MKLCNAVHYFKRALSESELEIEEIKFKTREAGQRFAWGIEEELEALLIKPAITDEANQIQIFGITFTWPKH